jgi:hypothetical protein
MKWIAIALLFGGCAADADHLRQACADTNAALNATGQVLLGEMQQAERDGSAKAKLACFEAAVATLHDLTVAKDQVCTNIDSAPDYKLYIAKAIALGPSISPIVNQYRTCVANIKGGN